MTEQCDIEIFYEILDIVKRAQDNSLIAKVIPTQVATLVNLHYRRFQKYLKQLVALEMIDLADNGLRITDKGLEFLVEVRQRNEFLRHLGLEI